MTTCERIFQCIATNFKTKEMKSEVEIIISEIRLNSTTAIKIMKCLKEHEPEIFNKLKETLKEKIKNHVQL